MDFQRLNELLSPYKIEIVCDTCQKSTDRSVRHRPDFLEASVRPEILQTEKKQTPKGSRVMRVFSHSKSAKTRGDTHRHVDSTQKFRRPEVHVPVSASNGMQRNVCVPRQNFLPNPPNNFLNLNTIPPEGSGKVLIQDLLESSRNTPHKIEDVEPERYYYSEKKEGALKVQLNQSTAQPMLFCPEESPISYRARRTQGRHETPLDERLALGYGPSRDTSPFRPILNRAFETPSHLDQTPRHLVQFTPNIRTIDPIDDNSHDAFNLLKNPFENGL